jgi:plastocyanin
MVTKFQHLLFVFGMIVFGFGSAAAGGVTHHQVEIKNMSYQPQTITVVRGDVVTWTNADIVPHTVTARGGAFDSGEMLSQQSWSHTMSKAGKFPYYCVYHAATMSGLVIVKDKKAQK